uniref:Uncharacterized protein n=1 Tax=Trichogramma kaykai TaxID=54128 RepID=A0ABD2X3Q9_9HYME
MIANECLKAPGVGDLLPRIDKLYPLPKIAFHQPHTHLHTHKATCCRAPSKEEMITGERATLASLLTGAKLFLSLSLSPSFSLGSVELSGKKMLGIFPWALLLAHSFFLAALLLLVLLFSYTLCGFIGVLFFLPRFFSYFIIFFLQEREREKQDWQWEIIIFLARQKRGRRGGDLARGTSVYIQLRHRLSRLDFPAC